jgi:hypothetical protein
MTQSTSLNIVVIIITCGESITQSGHGAEGGREVRSKQQARQVWASDGRLLGSRAAGVVARMAHQFKMHGALLSSTISLHAG